MSYDPNLPAGLPSDFNDEPVQQMKPCHICKGEGEIKDYGEGTICPLCEGKKEIELDCMTIAEALEDMREQENRHKL